MQFLRRRWRLLTALGVVVATAAVVVIIALPSEKKVFSAADCAATIQHELDAGVKSKLRHLDDRGVHAATVVCNAIVADLDVDALSDDCGGNKGCMGLTAMRPCIVTFKLGVQKSLLGVDSSEIQPHFDLNADLWSVVGGELTLVLPNGEEMSVDFWTWDNAMGLCQAVFFYLATGEELWRR